MTTATLRTVTPEELATIMAKHLVWLRGDPEGIRADLTWANLTEADLTRANLTRANLYGANLTGAKNAFDAIDYISEHFERDADGRGIIAYKTFGTQYAPNPDWKIEAGSVLREVVNPLPTCDCASGINVATRDWHRKTGQPKRVWKALIRWEWMAGVVVPWRTDGKIRCSRVELLEEVALEAEEGAIGKAQ